MDNVRDQPMMETLLMEAKMEDMAERAAVKAVGEFLTKIGLDTADPIRLQTDFATIRQLMRDQDTIDDMIFLRRLRKQMQSFSTKIGYVIITIFLVAIAGVLGFGLKTWLGVFPK